MSRPAAPNKLKKGFEERIPKRTDFLGGKFPKVPPTKYKGLTFFVSTPQNSPLGKNEGLVQMMFLFISRWCSASCREMLQVFLFGQIPNPRFEKKIQGKWTTRVTPMDLWTLPWVSRTLLSTTPAFRWHSPPGYCLQPGGICEWRWL